MSDVRARRIGLAIRIAVGAVVVAWLVRRLDLRAVVAAFSTIPVATLGASFLCALTSVMLSAYRWGLLIVGYGGKRVRYATLLRHTFEGLVLATLPSGLAGDAARGYRVREAAGGLTRSYAVLIVERVAGLTGLMVLVVATSFERSAPTRFDATFRAFAVAGLLLAIVFFAFAAGFGNALLSRIPLVRGVVARIGDPPRLGVLSRVLAISVGTQLAITASMVLLVHAVAPLASWSAISRVAPFVLLTIFVPITPAAAGQRELAFAELFGLAGVSKDAAVAASLAWFGLVVVLLLVGSLTLLCEPEGERRT
jgi:uncharacterized membrane protein YbhN (UPF0104 family)